MGGHPNLAEAEGLLVVEARRAGLLGLVLPWCFLFCFRHICGHSRRCRPVVGILSSSRASSRSGDGLGTAISRPLCVSYDVFLLRRRSYRLRSCLSFGDHILSPMPNSTKLW